jgi:hypothetical protein
MLKIGSCFDYLDIHNGHVTGNNGNDSVWNIAFYSTIQATDKLSFNLRAEYLSTADISAGDATTIFGSGVYGKNTAEELTATVQYNLWANVISRAEVRWDHTEHFNGFGANAAGVPSGTTTSCWL